MAGKGISFSSVKEATSILAYERMRANWYKRNLIQIKYIKLAVYHRRFKNSVNKNTIIA